MRNERPLRAVPKAIWGLLLVSLATQITFHAHLNARAPEPTALPKAPPIEVLRALSFGEDFTLAKGLMLWLQSHDLQPGLSRAFKTMDYGNLRHWLQRVLTLDPGGSYPLLMASRVYAEVPDPARQRIMLDFVYQAFLADPDGRWQWLVHAVYVAKHRLKDLQLALTYATALREQTTAAIVPSWARQMAIFVHEDLGEIHAAKILLGGLLESGEVTDPHERRFLAQRLAKLEGRAAFESRTRR